MKIGICIDEWKLDIFDKHLKAADFAYTNNGKLMAGVLSLQVETDRFKEIEKVVRAANDEAARTKH